VQYLDFELEVSGGETGSYTVKVRSPAGEATATMQFPFDHLALTNRLQNLQIALLRGSGTRRRIESPESVAVQEFGLELWQALFSGDVQSRYEASREVAKQRASGMRIKFRCDDPQLASLPWEYLFDPVGGDFLTLSAGTPLVRYIPRPTSMAPLVVAPPLRVLAMAVSPSDLEGLDAEQERNRLDAALETIQARGLVKLTWVVGQTWRDFQEALWEGPWHVFHFIGHGGFDDRRKEGILAFARPDGKADFKRARSVGRLLGDHGPLRLAVLNACESGRVDVTDVFSSTAGTLIGKGTPAVVAMQYEITDEAAIELSRSFYGAVARGIPVDTALAEARKGLATTFEDTLEWGTPVLYLQTPDGVLFDVTGAPVVEPVPLPPPMIPPEPEPEPPEPEPPEPIPPEPEPPEPEPEPEPPEPAPPEPEPPEPAPPEPAPPEPAPPEPAPPEPAPPQPHPQPLPPPPPSRALIAVLAAGGAAAVLGLLFVVGLMVELDELGGSASPSGPGFPTDTVPVSGAPLTEAPQTGGTGILFEFDPDGTGPDDPEIYLLDPDTGEGRPITDNDVPDRWPRWSPDGMLIAFTRMDDGAGDIYLMDARGGNEVQLTSGPDDDWGPDFSPNSFIVFNSDRNESDKRLHDIWGIDETGAGLDQLWGEPGVDDRSPAWAPDGSRMAYSTERDGEGRAIYTVDVNGKAARHTFGGTIDRNPSWRPDGRGLLFSRNLDRSGALRDIWSFDADTGAEIQLTNDPADEGNPVYSPDGTRIVFYRRVGEAWHLFVRDLGSGDEQDLTASLGGNSLDPSWR
jgi:Tol biopolymer transport system component